MDKFQEMQAFIAVVEAGSFVRASDSLAMSKLAVSRQLADLETRLGVRLLHRTTRWTSWRRDSMSQCASRACPVPRSSTA